MRQPFPIIRSNRMRVIRNMFDFEEELKKLPGKPGVYLMHGENDEIIYVGKAVSLKNRVRQYFQSSRNKGPKIEKMVTHISRFEYIITDSELEALVLECNLIKEHRPKYNTMLKDDKTYPYIKVTVGETFPRILSSRQMKKDSSKYFGPYTSARSVKVTVELLQKLYHLRTCRRNLPKDMGKDRPCLNYHMKRCPAPCQGYISKEKYRDYVNQTLSFLNGNYGPVLKQLEDSMKEAASKLEFEQAAEYKELLGSVRQIAQKQKITSDDGEDKDIMALALSGKDAVMQVFFIRDGKLIGREHYYLNVAEDDDKQQIITSFLTQYYAGTPFIPRGLMLQEEPEDQQVIEEWLTKKRGQRVYIRIPKKGEKEKLVELAEKNADLVLKQDKERLKREEGRTIGAMKEVAGWIHLSGIKRVEAYDISNISGYQTVGSMIVYDNGKPQRSDYRKFKIKTISGQDDYGSMKEMLTRRFIHGLDEQQKCLAEDKDLELGSFTKFPDLILMDGGKGQVNIAKQVLEELELTIPVCGMVKDDNHRTRGLYVNNQEIPIDRNSEGFKLITRIQDEAHRFAIEYHRSLRSKGQVHSVLDDIEGIGPTRRKSLMKSFQSLEQMKEASVETLLAVPSMNEKAAQAVYDFLHS